ncbi:AAA family ATPase [Photobacterium alginatilyticum]|uniref:DUF3696 domain-containing protein n=1 Tax=Photobacterium alginatilyticum TaxID=1775171 RepID=A0ABW9YJ22_9GAMM|nr:DUF3696 domain-containing protein [Photobacterium alginatilyticum]NBI53829.1 DUF3696 domain-containing protein [Photobacterium alginatilyticum]
MRITKLSLTNFRSFKETQTIEFAPVTLLFGPNSVGKSTVLMALFYLQQVLEKGQCNPLRLEALGNKFVGGFKNLVHGRNLSKPIVIKIEYEVGETFGSGYFDYVEDLDLDVRFALDTEIVEYGKRTIELEIAWSDFEHTAYVRKCRYWISDTFLGELDCSSSLRNASISMLNYLHPALIPLSNSEWLEGCSSIADCMHSAVYEKEMMSSNFEKEHLNFKTDDNNSVSSLHQLMNHLRVGFSNIEKYSIFCDGYRLAHVPIGFHGSTGALPKLQAKMKTDWSIDEDKKDFLHLEIDDERYVNELLSECFVRPLDDLLNLLNDSLCIGPLRDIPDVLFQPNPHPEAGDWYNGRAAWDSLSFSNTKNLIIINEWIARKDKLDLGYGIALKTEKKYAEVKVISKEFSYDVLKDQVEHLIPRNTNNTEQIKEVDEVNVINKNILWDLNNKIEVTPAEVGVGVSQLMPLVVATFTQKKGIIACEQPELHVHPRIQVAIGDLLTQANDKVSYLIETHSEHLILRLLRRIRETTDGELPEGIKPVRSSDVSIMYIEPSSEGVAVKKIEIDEDGEFKSRWPQGFFSERREELF